MPDVARSVCEVLGGLRGLQHLDMRGLPLDAAALSLSQLTQMTYLRLESCEIPDIVASAVGVSLRQLVHLNLGRNDNLSDGCMPALGLLSGLTHLDICGSKVTTVGLGLCTSLRRLAYIAVPGGAEVPEALTGALPLWCRPLS